MPIAKSCIEYDHFPIPKRNGGKDTVAVCYNCHLLKDRTAMVNLPTFISEAYGLWEKLTPIQRIILAKYIMIMSDEDKKGKEKNEYI